MKILVTGWNGLDNKSFIPKTLALHLTQKGYNVDIWSWDDDYKNNFYGWTWSKSIARYVHAVNSGVDWERSPITKYDLIIHLGAISSTTESNVEEIMEKNFDFSLWLLNQCQLHKIPLHYASSASVYGQKTHFQEDGPCDPKTPYAWSKYFFDRIIQEHGKTFRSPVLGLRYFNVYGDFEGHKGEQASVIYKWQNQITSLGSFCLYKGSENFYRDFIWVKDICEVHEKLIGCEATGVFNLGTGKSESFQHIADCFVQKHSCDYSEIDFPERMKCQYQTFTESDNTNLLQLIDHKFTTVDEYFDKHY